MQTDKLLQKAEDAIRKNNSEYALQFLEQIFKVDPDNSLAVEAFFDAVEGKWRGKKLPKPKTLGTMTVIGQAKLGRWDAVSDAARAKLPNDPANTKLFALWAEALKNSEHWNAAAKVCERWTKADPKDATGWYWYAQALKKTDDWNEALEAAQKAYGLDKTNRDVGALMRDLQAQISMGGGKSGKASMEDQDDFREFVKESEEDKKDIQKRRGDSKEGLIQELKEAGGLKGLSDKKIARDLANRFEKLSEYSSASQLWKKLYELDNSAADALDAAGRNAIKYYEALIEKALEANDQDKVAEYEKKKAAFQISEYKRQVEAYPNDLGLRYEFGRALFEGGRYHDSISQLQKALKDPKKANQAGLLFARALIEDDKLDVAKLQLEKIKDGDAPDETKIESKYFLGIVHDKKGEPDQAKSYFMEIYMEDAGYRDVEKRIS